MNFAQEIIRSRQNRGVVETAKLTDRREREERKLFRFDGIKLFEEAIKNGVELTCVYLKESKVNAVTSRIEESYPGALDALDCRACILADEVFDKISEEKSPEGVICVAKYIDKSQKIVTIYNVEEFFQTDERIVLLESVRDPSNIGAIIRSAAAIGIDRLILSGDCADIYHPKAVRASMGTVFSQRIDRTDSLTAAVERLCESGRRVYAAALDETAHRLGDFAIRRGDCVVIGNEGHGLSEELMKACSGKVYIPMSPRAESFNAAVAASILMWEFAKN